MTPVPPNCQLLSPARRTVSVFLILAIGSPLFVACGGGGGSQNLIDISSFERPYTYQIGGRPAPAWDEVWPAPTYVIRSSAEFKFAWQYRQFSGRPFDPLPIIDFGRFTLLGISHGEGSACAELRITRVQQVGDILQVESQLTNPPGACIFSANPVFDFVQVPKTDLDVRFMPTVVILAK